MSVMPHAEPECAKVAEPTVELSIDAHSKNLGDGFVVRRVLPSLARRMVGPFIFFDQMGPRMPKVLRLQRDLMLARIELMADPTVS